MTARLQDIIFQRWRVVLMAPGLHDGWVTGRLLSMSWKMRYACSPLRSSSLPAMPSMTMHPTAKSECSIAKETTDNRRSGVHKAETFRHPFLRKYVEQDVLNIFLQYVSFATVAPGK
ncbi:unnamed protein product [Soboliphyme baturini]|uniref:Protein kinase domain-containing protein n=1 Tax=Soboliphyme baturini TaxID=241478 RepID=A0A183JAN2_9BILA|nr:unnamed protein product [Soboliphyme baturini]